MRVSVHEHAGSATCLNGPGDGLAVAQKDLISRSPEVFEPVAACRGVRGHSARAGRARRCVSVGSTGAATGGLPPVSRITRTIARLERDRRQAAAGERLHRRWFEWMVIRQRRDDECSPAPAPPRDPTPGLHVPIVQLHPELLPRKRQHLVSQQPCAISCTRGSSAEATYARPGPVLRGYRRLESVPVPSVQVRARACPRDAHRERRRPIADEGTGHASKRER